METEIIKEQGMAMVVQWNEGGELHRSILPKRLLAGYKIAIPVEVLRQGIPYDIDKRIIPVLSPILNADQTLAHRNMTRSCEIAGIPTEPLVIIDSKNIGFVKTFNRGMRQLLADSNSKPWDYVCYLPSDMYYEQENWLKMLVDIADTDPLFGLIAPSHVCGTAPQKSSKKGMEAYYEVVQHLAWNGGLVRWEVFEKIGLLNEIYQHYGADYEFLHEAQEAGYKAVWVHDVWGEHDWQPDRYPEWVAHDRPLYYSRWGKDGKRIAGRS